MSFPDQVWDEQVAALGTAPDDEVLGALTSEMAHAATAAGRASMRAFLDPAKTELGRQMLVRMDFAALMAMIYSPPHADPSNRAWLMTVMTEAELHLRGQLVSRLKEALTDREWVDPPAWNIELEVSVPQRRVCDEAYLQLRQLFHPEEDQVGFSVDRNAFLNFPVELRDQVINDALQRDRWNLSPYDLY